MNHSLSRCALPLLLSVLAAPAIAEDVTQIPLPVPSGQPVYWQETIHGIPGTHGLTYRFRFVAPDLADLAAQWHQMRTAKGMTAERALTEMRDPIRQAAMRVHLGQADGTVGGAVATTADRSTAAPPVLPNKT